MQAVGYTIGEESFDSLASYWLDPGQVFRWPDIFATPPWLKAWWESFDGGELWLRTIRQDGRILGIAPLAIKNGTAFIIGSTDICDYADFIVAPGRERDFFGALLDALEQVQVKHIDFSPLRPDSTVMTGLISAAQERDCTVFMEKIDVSVELDLPRSWEDYLAMLGSKQRHEINRKLRRLSELGHVKYHVVDSTPLVSRYMDIFLKMFVQSKEEKAHFLSPRMESFFRTLTSAMARDGLLRLGILELDEQPVAMVMCFAFDRCIYLYNSGYDPDYSAWSAGLLCKVLAIKDSIQKGKKKFDFLKGGEPYKYQLGGREVPLYRCQINLT